MDLKISTKLGQTLNLTPRLQQSIKLMQLNRMELIRAIENELLENPVLTVGAENLSNSKQDSADSSQTAASDQTVPTEHQSSNFEIDFAEGHVVRAHDGDYSNWLENLPASQDPLLGMLSEQIDLSLISPEVREVLAYIVGNLDESGFINETEHEIAHNCAVSIETVDAAYEVLRNVEPVGIGSRNVQECLILQLDNMGLADSLAARIVNDHLERLARNQFSEIAAIENTSMLQVNHAASTIKQLSPCPRGRLQSDATHYVIADLSMEYDPANDSFRIVLNDDGIPRLTISPLYQGIASASTSEHPETKYLRSKIADANWLIRSIEQRRNTMRRVAETLANVQKDYLLNGREFLKPLTMKAVAQAVGVHESTVSRIVNSKYALTPQGLIELKCLFSQSIAGSEQNVSAMTVKKLMQDLIASEPNNKPISDQDLVSILKRGHKLEISRRTVAKYRDELGIPSSHNRKRFKSQQLQ